MTLAETAQAQFLKVHQYLYEHSDGRIGHRMVGVPSLLLTTTGRRSGQRRTIALIYAADGASFVVVASNGGQDRPPAWLLNVRAEPNVSVQVARRRVEATAQVVEASDQEFGRLWALVNRVNHGRYDRYQSKTSRPIPVVRLSPR